jgi:acyl-CoA synthetase (AMP-forming)/AMP-acid ligase II
MSNAAAAVENGASTLVAGLRWRAQHQSEQVACSFLDDDLAPVASLSYADLDRRARAIAGRLARIGCRGERAVLLYPAGLEFVEAFFGCAYAGVIAVPMDVPRPRRDSLRLDAVARDAQPELVLTTTGIADPTSRIASSHPLRGSARWIASDQVEMREADAWKDPGCSATDVVMLQYTSGSTSDPKGAVITHGNVVTNSERVARHFGHSASTRMASWLPHFHDMGLIGTILHPILHGFPTTLMSPLAFVQRPVRWLKMISKLRATTSGAPNFAYELCVQRVKDEARAGLDLSSWEVAFNGAEPVRASTLERFATAFAPCGFRRDALFPCYGLAESTLLVAGGPRERAPRLRERPEAAGDAGARPRLSRLVVSCGPCVDPRDLVIVDPETLEPQAQGEIGEIWLRGPCVARGYWRESEDGSRFGARLRADADASFFRTGDLGFVADGEIYVTGRLGDRIIVAGAKHHPVDIEATVDGCHPWLSTGRSFAFGLDAQVEEQLVVAVELHRREWTALRGRGPRDGDSARRPSRASFDPERLIGDIREAVLRDHGVGVHDVALLPPGGLPRTTSGKVRRRACVTAYRNGAWRARRVSQAREPLPAAPLHERGLTE